MARKNRKPKKPKPPKVPLGRRIGDNIRAVGLVGADAVRNPRGIPNTAHGLFRRWFRRIWDTRGGGLYTLGYALTFAALEVKTIIGELVGMTSASDYFMQQLMEFMMRFGADSIRNLVLAFMWPVFIVTWRPPWGAILFSIGVLAFPHFLKPYIERWLFRDEKPPARAADE